METALADLLFGWAALLSAAATLATLITGIAFFAVSERFGKLNDTASVFQMLLMLPVAVALYVVTQPSRPGLALLALGVGSAAMVIAAVLQGLLVVGLVGFEQTIGVVLSAGGAIGLWLIVANALTLTAGVLPLGLAAFGIAAGVGYVLTGIGFRRGGQEDPLFYVGSLLAAVGYVVWAAWLGRLLQVGGLATGTP